MSSLSGYDDGQVIDLDVLDFDPENTREHPEENLRLIESSLNEFGAGRSVVIKNGRLVAGEGTVKAARATGNFNRVRVIVPEPGELIAVQRDDWTDLEAARYSIMDNQSTDTSRHNEALIATLQARNPEMMIGIFNDSERDRFRRMVEERNAESAAEETEAPKTKQQLAQENWQVKRGQVWAIPSATMRDKYHVVMCGDSRDHSDWRTLMQGKHATGIFTSPPYAEQRAETYESIAAEKYLDWFRLVEANIRHALAPDGSFFLNIKEHVDAGARDTYVLKLALWMSEGLAEELGESRVWWWIDTNAWTRPGMPGKQGPRFKNGWEPVYHWALAKEPKWRPENVMDLEADLSGMTQYQGAEGNVILGRPDYDGSQKGRKTGLRAYADGAMPSNVISVNKGFTPNPGHGARFPIDLPEFFMRAYSDPGDLWVDPFVGSGTTILAGESSGRIVYGMDLDPASVAVTLTQLAALDITPHMIEEGYDG